MGDSMDPIRRRAIQLAAVSMAYLEQLGTFSHHEQVGRLFKQGWRLSG